MYTPSVLNQAEPQYTDRPFAGHLFGTVRAQVVDQERYDKRNGRPPRLSLLAASSEVILGVKGVLAGARQTQSLAHWTWSTEAVRPTGWRDQLRNEFMGGVTIEGVARPRFLEHCKNGCSGALSEERRADLTPRGELVLNTAVVRGSLGTVLRLGRNMPSAVSLDRLPSMLAPKTAMSRTQSDIANKRQQADSARLLLPASAMVDGNAVAARSWWLVFATADLRAVARNAFLEGGFTDGGSSGWSANRQIDARPFLGELGLGAQVNRGHYNAAIHLIHRNPEYRVRNEPDPRGVARFVSLTFARTNF